MDSGAASILAAAIGFAGLVYQQARHWRETRRDKVRESYADWMSALLRVRRTEERFLIKNIHIRSALRARAAAGDPLARQGGLEMSQRDAEEIKNIELEIEAGNRELDICFGKVCLLDRDWRRIIAAQKVRNMETLPEARPGEAPSMEEFDANWLAKSTALGELSDLVNRSLFLEGTPSFLWDRVERTTDKQQEALHSRLNTTRRGKRKHGT